MNHDELDLIEHLISTVGLVKVWDGTEYRDLRLDVKRLVAHIRTLQERCDALQERTDVILAEHNRTLLLLDSAHAEIARLGAVLRDV